VAVGWLAVGAGGQLHLRARVVIEQRLEQAARLVPAIDEALLAADIARTQLAGLVVGE
jgi:hypothetical protein